MANAMYDSGRQKFLEGNIAWLTDTIKCVLVNIAGGHYVVNLGTHQFLSSILSGDRVGTSNALSGKTSTAGVANASQAVFPQITGAACGALVIYKDTGDPTTSPLIAYIDTASGLPVTPNGGDILISWDTGSSKILKL
jgi:hypothetical protein